MPVILRESGESMDIKCQRWNSAYAKLTNAAGRGKEEALPRKYTETKHIFQSRMRERRYKYTIWKGPFRQVQSPGNLCGMSAFALKGQNEIAQGNALGKWPNKTPSPERAKGFGR